MPGSNAELFRFEEDYREDLHFVPMAMRYRLDLAGMKVGLAEWLLFPVEERFALAAYPLGAGSDCEGFRQALRAVARVRLGREPQSIAPADAAEWGVSIPLPEPVRAACEGSEAKEMESHWAGLSDLRRYALLKMASSRRQPDGFRRAREEFSGG